MRFIACEINELLDEDIIEALEKCIHDYNCGYISEVRDVLKEIVDSIDQFTEDYTV